MTPSINRCLLGLIVLAAVACSPEPSQMSATATRIMVGPTFAIVNARIWTGDAAKPWAEAIALAGEEILAVGTNAEIRRLSERIPPFDAGGRLVVPGFIDSHVHFLEGGFRLASVQLREAKSRDEFVNRIKAFAATVPAGTWITGGDWDHSLWGGELPRRDWIDAVTPTNPVWVNRLDGHMALANSAALKAASVTAAPKVIEGGEIVRTANGEPTGLLKDNAMTLVDKVVPPPSDAMRDRALAAAMRYVNEQGVTTIHNMGSWPDLDTFARARKSNALRTRVYSVLPLADWERVRDLVARTEHGGADGRGDDWLRVGGLKGFVDGSLGSHTAAFHEPFVDAPKDRGLLINTPEDLHRWIAGADSAGLHVMVHACGDRANSLLLDLFEKVGAANGPRDRRFRIEHAQHLTAADIPRFGKLGVIASMQPYHAIDDGRWAEKYIGARINTTYAFRSLLDAGATLALGSDWFVAPPTPLEGIYAAVTRRTIDDRHPNGWVPAQKITVEEARGGEPPPPPEASFDETRKGILSVGRLADLVMVDRNIFEIPAEEIRNARVVMTVVGGQKVLDKLSTITTTAR
jgi:predicted amidohydrolase YtcJ